jgi:arginine decarboxylase
MRIVISQGIGEAPTPLAAYDSALLDAGVQDYNLIPLSSVIPPESTIERGRHVSPRDDYGRRLYVVMAHQHAAEPGTGAYAGLGWAQETEGGRGLFVECHGASRQGVEEEIEQTLNWMCTNRDREYGPVQSEVTGVECTGRPVCAVVVAVYKSEPWG